MTGPPRRRANLGHAARVAALSTLVVASAYVVVSVVFDVVDSHHLVAEVDARLTDRLLDVARTGEVRAASRPANDHDVEAAPVLVWRVTPAGHAVSLSDGAPKLPVTAWSRAGTPTTATIGSATFRFAARRVGSIWLVSAQSLSETVHVERVLIAAEAIAGPAALVVFFLGAMVIGVQASRPVEEARRRQLEFTADASHELRTPLSVIEAEVSLALGTRRHADDYRATLERVGGESQRLRRIIEDLLWLARFDSEPAPPRAEVVDLRHTAAVCAERFGAVARARRISLTVDGAPNPAPCLDMPPDWADRLAGVLVDNACRHAGAGGTVTIHTAVHGARVVLAVDGSGPGIPPEERPLLFDRFHRATDEGSGTGLGLAIADSIVRSTGGRWKVDDSVLGGARMEVSWHRSHQRDAEPNASAPPAPDPPEVPADSSAMSR